MRGARVIPFLLMLLFSPWSTIYTENSVFHSPKSPDYSELSNDETIAVPGGFHHSTYINYSDVAIVINNRSTDSVLIGNAFASARDIPPERIFLLTNESTPTSETINADQFDTYFADPIRLMIQQRGLFGDLNYLVTTKGVPLRINGGTNIRASFDSELALIDSGQFGTLIHGSYWGEHEYGPWSNNNGDEYATFSSDPVPEFRRSEQGFYIVTRLTGYDVDTAISLIDKANNSFGSYGQTVLDLATNRNGSGSKFWNDALYSAHTHLNETLGIPVLFNQNSTFVTGENNVMMYASWGSNDDSWNNQQLPDNDFGTPDGSYSSGIRSWSSSTSGVSIGETLEWDYDSDNAAARLSLDSAQCSATNGENTNGLLAEYFDNQGITYNSSFMPDLNGRVPNHVRSELNINYASSNSFWPGLDSRFSDYFSVRHSGVLTIPEAGNWTFYSNADDGVMVWINDQLIVNNSGVHGMREVSGSIELEQGEHTFRSEFFEHGGGAGHIVSWEGPNQSKQVIPSTSFTRALSSPVRSDILIHHWDFEAGNGTIIEDLVGEDNLTMTGGPTWQSCLLGNCISLDGIDDILEADVDDRLGDFTISLWAKANHTGQSRYSSVIAVNDVGGDSDSFQIMTSGSTPGVWQLYHNRTYDFGPVSASDWVHFAVAKEGDKLMQYMDGILVGNITIPNGSIDEIDLYKFGVNRAGNTYWSGLIDEVQVWTEALNSSEITLVNGEVALDCPYFTSSGQGPSIIWQEYQFDVEKMGHAWTLSSSAQLIGEVNADWTMKVEGLDSSNNLLSTNFSNSKTITTSWSNSDFRFRPHQNVTKLNVSLQIEIQNVSRQGAIYLDNVELMILQPHMQWVDGSIAETAVSTGGRTFTWGTDYGQSLVADLVEDGVSGVKGYVYEPYLSAVSYPDILTSLYASGYNLGESYTASNGYLSWMGVIVGDPKMSPFSNRLHDIEIRNVSVSSRPSVGTSFDVQIDLANIGPSAANGWIEVRERVGNRVLSNTSISIPSGDSLGSITEIRIPTVTESTGFVELQVRYIADNGQRKNSTTFVQSYVLNERVTSNNIASTIVEVNAPPSIDLIDCSSSIAPRGSTVSCWIDVSDEFGVRSAFFRINGVNESMIFEGNATSSNGIRWTIFFDIPGSASLGLHDLFVKITDIDGLTDLANESEILQVIDSPSIWYGIHIQNADDPSWAGDSALPSGTPFGMYRGVPTNVRACVEDVDHNPTIEQPIFLFERGEISSFQILPKENSSRFQCYSATLELGLDEPLSPFLARLSDSDGNIISTRSVLVDNILPNLQASFQRENIESLIGFGVGNESISISIIDPDSPFSQIVGQIEYSWPEQAPITAPFSTSGNGTTVQIPLLSPSSGLSAGNLEVRVSALDSDSGLSEIVFQVPIETRPPSVNDAVLCLNGEVVKIENGTKLVRGESMFLVVPVDEHRPILQVRPSLRQSGWSESLLQSSSIPAGCPFSPYIYSIELPDDLIEGNASIVIILSDVDGLATGWTEDVSIVFPPPSILNVSTPDNGKVGEEIHIEFKVRDPDDLNNVVCYIDILNRNSTIVYLEQTPSLDGEILVTWTPSRPMDNVDISIICEDGMNRFDSWNSESSMNITGTVLEIPVEEIEDKEIEESSQVKIVAIFIAIGLLFLIISTVFVWISRKETEIELSPWEIGGVLDATQAEAIEELNPQDAVELLETNNLS